jgi:hypothetical protein
MNRTGVVLFVALLVATAAVAAVVVHARTPDLELQVTRFGGELCPRGPLAQCRHAAQREHPNSSRPVRRTARLGFFVRESDPNATVEIVGPNLSRIRVLYRGPLAANEPLSYAWNGRDAAGRLVNPRHLYRLRVILPSRDRDMVYPRRIEVLVPGARK